MDLMKLERKFLADVANIVAVPIALIALAIAYLGYRSTWEVASLSGAFTKPEITLGLNKLRFASEPKASIIFGSELLHQDKTVIIDSIPFSVANEDDKTVDNLTVTVRTPAFVDRKSLEVLSFNAVGSVDSQTVKRSLTSGQDFDYSSYQIGGLNPGMGALVEEPFWVRETKVDKKFPVKTKDDVQLLTHVKFEYSIQWLVTVSGKDIKTRDYEIDVACVYAHNMDDLVTYFYDNNLKYETKTLRDRLGFLGYLSKLLFRPSESRVYLITQDYDLHKVEDGTLAGPAHTATVERISYDPYSWYWLFSFK